MYEWEHADARFARWYAQEAGPMRATLRVVTGDAEMADEASAEAFARAYAHWDRVEAMASPCGWVYTVALNLVRRWKRRTALERLYAMRFRPRDAAEMPEIYDDVWAAVHALPPRARTAIGLRYIADLPESDIAAILGISRGTVAATLSKARGRLAAELQTYNSCGVG